MPHSLLLELQRKQNQSLNQSQHLMMSKQMQQAIHCLQTPVLELTALIDAELEQNPLLEYSKEIQDEEDLELAILEEENKECSEDLEIEPEKELVFDEKDFEMIHRLEQDSQESFYENRYNEWEKNSDHDKQTAFLENMLIAKKTPFEHLMELAKETFEDQSEFKIAECIIGNLDESGFLSISIDELSLLENYPVEAFEKVLKVIQTFEPIGIGAKNLQESLLIQLQYQGKLDSLAYEMIKEHFDDLLHHRILSIKKKLKHSVYDIQEAIDKDIIKLDLHPAQALKNLAIGFIIPDVNLREEGDDLIAWVNDDTIPHLKLNSRYMKMLGDETVPKETKEFIKEKIFSAKWLIRNLFERSNTLEKIAQFLAVSQKSFFLNPEGVLVPLTMKKVAEEVGVHESTIARAVSNKYISTPRGIFPLRSFFTHALVNPNGEESSSSTALNLLKQMIEKEDKKRPFSDEALSRILIEKGIQCARRTVAKYRTELKIGNAQQRRKF